MRRAELYLVGGLAGALFLAIVLGKRDAPGNVSRDQRLSTFLTGPRGAKGLAQALQALGTRVVQRRQPLFRIARDSTEIPRGTTLALLDLEQELTGPEANAVTDFVDAGGRVFNVGRTGFEACVGYDLTPADTSDRFRPMALDVPDSVNVPAVRWVLSESVDSAADSSDALSPSSGPECDLLEADKADTLLAAATGAPVAIELTFDGGGKVTLVSDPALLANRGLKETDAGLVVLPWLLKPQPAAVVFDEYHQGFGEDGSLVGATWHWATGSPLGWVMIQLILVALVAIGAAAVRFGPALSAVERRRRSPTEHLEALAAGLERAEGRDTAVKLLARGLRRRLSRGAAAARGWQTSGDLEQWLKSLELAARNPAAQHAVKRFTNLTLQRGGDDQVLAAAIAVEDVWQALGPKDPRTRS